jgi:hypothetical protein
MDLLTTRHGSELAGDMSDFGPLYQVVRPAEKIDPKDFFDISLADKPKEEASTQPDLKQEAEKAKSKGKAKDDNGQTETVGDSAPAQSYIFPGDLPPKGE